MEREAFGVVDDEDDESSEYDKDEFWNGWLRG